MTELNTTISEAEREVLKVLWEIGPCAVRALRDALAARQRVWAHTTISTLLHRLEVF